MKKDMTYKVFIDDKLRPIDIYYKSNNPLYQGDIIHCRSYDEFVQCVEEKFKKEGSYPGFVSFDYLLTNVTMKITDTYEVHFNDEAYTQDGADCANWLVNFMMKNNLPLPNYIVHDTNVRGRMNIQKAFNSATSNIVSNPFTEPTPVVIETPVIKETPVVTKEVKTSVKETPVKEDKSEEISKEKIVILQEKYWENFKNYLEKNKSSISIKKVLPQFYINFPIGRSNFHLSVAVNSRKPRNLLLELCFMGENSKTNFDKLKKLCYKESIEAIDGLSWDRMEGKKMARLFMKIEYDFMNEKDWNNQFKWFMDNLEKMSNFFKSYIKEI